MNEIVNEDLYSMMLRTATNILDKDARLSYIMVLAPRRTHYIRKECGAA